MSGENGRVELTAKQMSRLLGVGPKTVVRLGNAGHYTIRVADGNRNGAPGQWVRYHIPLEEAMAFKAKVDAGQVSTRPVRGPRSDAGVKRGAQARTAEITRLRGLTARLEALLAKAGG